MYTVHLIPLCQCGRRLMLCVLHDSKRRPLCHQTRQTFKNRMMEGGELCVCSAYLPFLVQFQTKCFLFPSGIISSFMFECTSLIPTQTCSKCILCKRVCVCNIVKTGHAMMFTVKIPLDHNISFYFQTQRIHVTVKLKEKGIVKK